MVRHEKMDRSCDCHGDTCRQQNGTRTASSSAAHKYTYREEYTQTLKACTDGEANQQRLKDAALQIPAVRVEAIPKRSHLKFQNKAAEASPSERTRRTFLHSSREILAREWGRLGSAIMRAATAAAVCLTPSTGADEDDLHLPYMQLDKVTHAVSREAFGPLYLVT